MKQWIIEMPEDWKGDKDCVMCGAYRHICQSRFKDAFECPYANAKEAVEVKLDVDNELGLSVIDKKGIFHFEGQDKYYAVKEDSNG